MPWGDDWIQLELCGSMPTLNGISATCGSRIFGSLAVDLVRQRKSSTKSSAKEGKTMWSRIKILPCWTANALFNFHGLLHDPAEIGATQWLDQQQANKDYLNEFTMYSPGPMTRSSFLTIKAVFLSVFVPRCFVFYILLLLSMACNTYPLATY